MELSETSLCFYQKQDFRLNKSQNSSSLKPKPLIFRFMLKSPIIIIIIFWYINTALLNDSDSSSKNIERLPGSGGLYILKQSHLLFGIVSSDKYIPKNLTLSSKSLILLQIIPLQTSRIRPPQFLSLSRLALIW